MRELVTNKKSSKVNIFKLALLFIFCLLISYNFYITTLANTIDNINIDVLLYDDGSAHITESWTGTFNEGTENYLPIEDNNIHISDLRVYKDNVMYENIGDWDINASFNEKKNKCGINKTDKGIELCFGISEYGYNTYYFKYLMEPLVKSYKDYDALKCMFVNQHMSTFPTDVCLRLHLANGKELNYDNAKIWGFGFDGEAYIEDGEAILYSNSKLYDGNYVILMLSLEKGIINPITSVEDTFEHLREVTISDSSYSYGEELNKREKLERRIAYAIWGFFFLVIALVIFSKVSRHFSLTKFYRDAEYFRDKPNGGDISKSYVLFSSFDLWKSKESNVIGSIIIKMINDGNFEVVKEKEVGLFGIEKTKICLKLVKEPEDELCVKLYDIIKIAAGNDGILQENELKKHAERNYEALYDYLVLIKKKGESNLHKEKCYNEIGGNRLKDLTDVGKKELKEVYGLRKFLDELTLIKERTITESIIWEDLMVYATLFGNAKKVLNELKKVYPEKIVEIEKCTDVVFVSDMYYRTFYLGSLYSHMAEKTAMQAAKGLGGSVSFGGGFGGGFSGGGGGGGSR